MRITRRRVKIDDADMFRGLMLQQDTKDWLSEKLLEADGSVPVAVLAVHVKVDEFCIYSHSIVLGVLRRCRHHSLTPALHYNASH